MPDLIRLLADPDETVRPQAAEALGAVGRDDPATVPALAGQIYAMPGMETKLHGVLNRPGRFTGISANYSGAGFSGMRFAFIGTDDAGFEKWVEETRATVFVGGVSRSIPATRLVPKSNHSPN